MIIKKYANLLFGQSKDRGVLDELSAMTAGIFASSLALRFFTSPMHKKNKERILSKIMDKSGVSKVVSQFMRLIIRHKRLRELPEIIEEYSKLLDCAGGNKIAQVFSASPMNNNDKTQFGKLLESKFGKKIIVKYAVDPNIIGGIVVKCDSILLDASIKGTLDKVSSI